MDVVDDDDEARTYIFPHWISFSVNVRLDTQMYSQKNVVIFTLNHLYISTHLRWAWKKRGRRKKKKKTLFTKMLKIWETSRIWIEEIFFGAFLLLLCVLGKRRRKMTPWEMAAMMIFRVICPPEKIISFAMNSNRMEKRNKHLTRFFHLAVNE